MTEGKIVADVMKKTDIGTKTATSTSYPELDKIMSILSKVENILSGPLAQQIAKSVRRKAGIEDPPERRDGPTNITPEQPVLNIDKLYRNILSKLNLMTESGYDVKLSYIRDEMNKNPDKAKSIIKQFLG